MCLRIVYHEDEGAEANIPIRGVIVEGRYAKREKITDTAKEHAIPKVEDSSTEDEAPSEKG
jgi:hypothetical protein